MRSSFEDRVEGYDIRRDWTMISELEGPRAPSKFRFYEKKTNFGNNSDSFLLVVDTEEAQWPCGSLNGIPLEDLPSLALEISGAFELYDFLDAMAELKTKLVNDLDDDSEYKAIAVLDTPATGVDGIDDIIPF